MPQHPSEPLSPELRALLDQAIALRKEKRLSQREVAIRMDTKQSAVSDLEQGKGEIRLSTLQRYLRALDAGVAITFYGPDDKILVQFCPQTILVINEVVGRKPFIALIPDKDREELAGYRLRRISPYGWEHPDLLLRLFPRNTGFLLDEGDGRFALLNWTGKAGRPRGPGYWEMFPVKIIEPKPLGRR